MHEFFPPNDRAQDQNLIHLLRKALFQKEYYAQEIEDANMKSSRLEYQLDSFLAFQKGLLETLHQNINQKIIKMDSIVHLSEHLPMAYSIILDKLLISQKKVEDLSVEIDSLKINLSYKEKQLSELQNNLLETNNQNALYKADIDVLKVQLETSSQNLQTLTSNHTVQMQAFTSSLQQSNKNIDILERRLLKYETDIDLLKKSNNSLEELNLSCKTLNSDQELIIFNAKLEIKDRDQKIAELNEIINFLNTEKEALQNELKASRNDLKATISRLVPKKNEKNSQLTLDENKIDSE